MPLLLYPCPRENLTEKAIQVRFAYILAKVAIVIPVFVKEKFPTGSFLTFEPSLITCPLSKLPNY